MLGQIVICLPCAGPRAGWAYKCIRVHRKGWIRESAADVLWPPRPPQGCKGIEREEDADEDAEEDALSELLSERLASFAANASMRTEVSGEMSSRMGIGLEVNPALVGLYASRDSGERSGDRRSSEG